MNDTSTCKECGRPIHWIEDQQLWYHDHLVDMYLCPATVVEPAEVTA